MSHQKQTTCQVSIAKKQRRKQYALGCGLGLLPLLIGFLNVIFPCNLVDWYVLSVAYFLFLGELLITFVLLWCPNFRSIGLGLLTSVGVHLFLGILTPLFVSLLARALCWHFVF
jgi:hypothetical protein